MVWVVAYIYSIASYLFCGMKNSGGDYEEQVRSPDHPGAPGEEEEIIPDEGEAILFDL